MLSLYIIIITVLCVNAVCRDVVHDREPSRIPVKKLKRLSHRIRNVRMFVWIRIFKITPLTTKLHIYMMQHKH